MQIFHRFWIFSIKLTQDPRSTFLIIFLGWSIDPIAIVDSPVFWD